jgi:hypothetical protein
VIEVYQWRKDLVSFRRLTAILFGFGSFLPKFGDSKSCSFRFPEVPSKPSRMDKHRACVVIERFGGAATPFTMSDYRVQGRGLNTFIVDLQRPPTGGLKLENICVVLY